MGHAKIQCLTRCACLQEMRFINGLQHCFFQGLQSSHVVFPEGTDAVQQLQASLCWGKEDDISINETGLSLLFYAALANDHCAVLQLLAGNGSSCTDAVVRKPLRHLGQICCWPLCAAMSFASAAVVEALLNGRANPHLSDKHGTALNHAGWMGRRDNIVFWLMRFPITTSTVFQ